MDDRPVAIAELQWHVAEWIERHGHDRLKCLRSSPYGFAALVPDAKLLGDRRSILAPTIHLVPLGQSSVASSKREPCKRVHLRRR